MHKQTYTLTSVQNKVIKHVEFIHEIPTHRVTVQTFVFAFGLPVCNQTLHHFFAHCNKIICYSTSKRLHSYRDKHKERKINTIVVDDDDDKNNKTIHLMKYTWKQAQCAVPKKPQTDI